MALFIEICDKQDTPFFDMKKMGLCQEALDDMAVNVAEENEDEGMPGSPLDSLLFTRRGFRSSPSKTNNRCKNLDLFEMSEDGPKIEEDDHFLKTFEQALGSEFTKPGCVNGLCQKMLDDISTEEGGSSDSEEGSGPPSPLDNLLFTRRRRTLAEEVSFFEAERKNHRAPMSEEPVSKVDGGL